MSRYISIFIVIIFTSFFFFPFVPTFLPAANTKMILAGMGLLTLFLSWAKEGNGSINRDIFILTLFALLVGCVSIMSETYNETGGFCYATFFISMWVWLAAAYFISKLIEIVHGNVNIRLFCNYIIAVCVIQCIIAITKEYYMPLKTFVDNLVDGYGFMGKAEGRLYGIGAALDVAGLRFSAVLTMIAYFCSNNNDEENKDYTLYYVIAFLIISVIGSMISRTTLLGIVMALLYWGYMAINIQNTENGAKMLWRKLGILLLIIIPIMIVLYNTNNVFQQQLRFGFEGFFSLVEKGTWETNSNSILKNMVVFPEDLETWIIGDGYIAKPELINPYYMGPIYTGFYKDTDIGYILFLFYFGIIGVLTMIAYFVKATFICVNKYPAYKIMFFMMLIVNLIGWCKVTSDIFVAFAPFLILGENIIERKQIK